MRASIPTIAAVAAGAALLAAALVRRESHHGYFHDHFHDLDLDPRDHPGASAGAVLALAAAVGVGVLIARERRHHHSHGHTMHTVHESIELEVPVSTAYNQWTQFEEFPRFMRSVEEVRQLDDTHLHWRAVVGGRMKEWDAEITEQIPDQRIAWRSTGGVHNAGLVTFEKVADNRTRVDLHMEYEPETWTERLGGAMGGVKLTAKGNLKRFKKLMETRGAETGAWRGTVTQSTH